MAFELTEARIPFQRECALPVAYKGQALPCFYRADMICYGSILVELKALTRLSIADDAQVLNYMKAAGLNKALLFNFGASKLDYRRFVL